MIRYFASDMIKRAEQLADIENSDFISFGEKIALLNEAYQKVYQAGVNKDNNAFVRYINTKSKVIPLPPDFHQIKAITLTHCGEITTILRRPANQSLNLLSYDIINNVLQINGETSGDTICIEYFPTPVSLTFPNKDLDLDLGDNVLNMHKSVVLSLTGANDDDILIRDLNNSDFSVILSHTDYPSIAQYENHMEDDFITFYRHGDSYPTYFYDLSTGQMYSYNKTDSVTPRIAIYKGRTYVYTYSAVRKGQLSIPAGGSTRDITVIDHIPFIPSHYALAELLIFSDDLNHCVQQIYDTIVSRYMTRVMDYHPSTDSVSSHSVGDWNTQVFSWNDKVFIYRKNSYFLKVYDFKKTDSYDWSGMLIADTAPRNAETSELKSAIVSIVGINDNTGYGYLGFRLGKYSLVSFFDDTELNFPKNIYFTYMAYLLALAFKSKQGSDTTQLAALTLDAENQFYDSLGRDDWGCTRITNVY